MKKSIEDPEQSINNVISILDESQATLSPDNFQEIDEKIAFTVLSFLLGNSVLTEMGICPYDGFSIRSINKNDMIYFGNSNNDILIDLWLKKWNIILSKPWAYKLAHNQPAVATAKSMITNGSSPDNIYLTPTAYFI